MDNSFSDIYAVIVQFRYKKIGNKKFWVIKYASIIMPISHL